MTRRMSKSNSPNASLLAITIGHVLQSEGLVFNGRADTGLCRWDSDDLSDILDGEWDDDA